MSRLATAMAEVFAADGPLAAAIPGFAVRDEQLEMAERVATALETAEHLVIEAGTGTGKTFAYLVPALLSARRVIISTGTRALQDQLFHRDLPTVSAALGRPARVALLKGRANYLCLHRLAVAEQQAYARGLRRELARALGRVREWAQVTGTGDIAELAVLPEQDPVWPWVTSTRENCLGAECPDYGRCHVVAARREAQGAEIVVVNHHLLMADLVLKEEGFSDLLPGADAVVIDEAHQLPEVASQFLGFAVSGRQIAALARDLAAELLASPLAGGEVSAQAQTLERLVTDAGDALGSGPERLDQAAWPGEFIDVLGECLTCLDGIAQSLESAGRESAALAAVRRRAGELSLRLGMLLAPVDDPDLSHGVRWLERSARSFTVRFVPIDVAGEFAALVNARPSAWIATSATLAVGDDFTHFTRRLGLRGAATARFGSPFDYPRQALLFLPAGLDAPSAPTHTRQFIDAVLPVLEASGGRAFLLFTSHRALREAARLLASGAAGSLPYPLLVQGEAPRDVLINRFRAAGNAVLLGTGSFWEGIDVKGDALTVVAIDKLPFAAPDDPVLRARLETIARAGGNPFFEEQVPQAVIALKQGVGRLIRDPGDYGVVVICDPRLRTRPYGRIFLASLPPMPVTSDLRSVCEFLESRRGTGEAADAPARGGAADLADAERAI
jgi:ATP-dependent DNA helicase DinG